eukprot:10965436-Heterocapsa_arctica.AAC.1
MLIGHHRVIHTTMLGRLRRAARACRRASVASLGWRDASRARPLPRGNCSCPRGSKLPPG